MRLGSKLRRTIRVRGLRRSDVVTLPPGIPRLGVVFRRSHFQGCALKSGPVARSEALTRDGARKVELYQPFCNIVGGVSSPYGAKNPSKAFKRETSFIPSQLTRSGKTRAHFYVNYNLRMDFSHHTGSSLDGRAGRAFGDGAPRKYLRTVLRARPKVVAMVWIDFPWVANSCMVCTVLLLIMVLLMP